MGWLEDLTNWFKDAIEETWSSLVDLVHDFILWNVENCMQMWLIALNAIPVPDFLLQYNLGTMLQSAGPTVGWLLNTFRIPEALLIIGAGWAFRLTRKALTLGQW